MGFFSKHANIHVLLAENAVRGLAREIKEKELGPQEFVAQAERLVPNLCERAGLGENLSNEQYKEIAQAAIYLNAHGPASYNARRSSLLKHFKK